MASVCYLDDHRGRGLVANVDFNSGDLILCAPYDIAVLYSPFVRNTCYRCFARVVGSRKDKEERGEALYECTSCKHMVLCTSCVKELVVEVVQKQTGAAHCMATHEDAFSHTTLLKHPLLEAHRIACEWFCSLPESSLEGDTDCLRFALQYGARALMGDTRLLLALGDLCTSTAQQSTESVRFWESFAQRVVKTFGPKGYCVDTEPLRDVLLRTQCNSIGYPFNDKETTGWSLQKELCMINHSCVPNAAILRPKRLTPLTACSMELLARRPIKAGEEITIAYIDIDSYADDVVERRRLLSERYGFECRCEKCLNAVAKVTITNKNKNPITSKITTNSAGPSSSLRTYRGRK